MPMQADGALSLQRSGPIALQPLGQWSLRAVCGVAALANSQAIGGTPRTKVADWATHTPPDVLQHALLRHVTVPHAWLRWSEAHGLADVVEPLAGPQFDPFQTMICAVMAGMGVALVPRCLVHDEITSGLVREPLADQPLRGGYQSGWGYWFCYPEGCTQLHATARNCTRCSAFSSGFLPVQRTPPPPLPPPHLWPPLSPPRPRRPLTQWPPPWPRQRRLPRETRPALAPPRLETPVTTPAPWG